MRSTAVSTLLSLTLLAGCAGKPADQVAAVPAQGAADQPVASHATATPPAGGPTAEGTVLETMDAAQYTYVRVKTASGEIWAASSPFKVAVGDRVIVPLDGPMEKFHSPTLKRDFPLIYFAPAIAHVGEQDAALPPGHAPVGAAKPDVSVKEPIPPPAGGMTIAKLWENRKTLGGKTVTVRGKVVKFNGGILGLNWTHLQDGSGVEKDGTNDITITSAAETKLGDVITVTGTVVLDKDFGAGYAYKVILQNATMTVK